MPETKIDSNQWTAEELRAIADDMDRRGKEQPPAPASHDGSTPPDYFHTPEAN